MTGRYNGYWENFYIRQNEHWSEVFSKTKNPEAKRRLDEIKAVLYKYWLIEINTEPAADQKQYLLF